MTLLALITTVGMAFGQAEFSGEGTSESPYLINDASDWAKFTALVNEQNSDYVSAYYELTNDLTLGTENEPITTVVGSDRAKKFKGTFDGGYHTLLIYMSREEDYAAPFGVAANATIKNLRVAGTIVSKRKWAAGIVGYTENDNNSSTNIINCISSVHINCDNIITVDNKKPYDCTYGGLVGQNESGSINFTNCIFDGEIVDTREPGQKKARRCAGFIAWVNKGVSFTNCIMAGKLDVLPNGIDIDNSMATFYRTKDIAASYSNCYFINDYTYYQSKDKIIKVRQGEPATTVVPVDTFSIQLNQGDKYYFVSGAQFTDKGNTMSFNGWTFNDTDYNYSVENGAKGINHVYRNGYLTATFTERYELLNEGKWDIADNWKYGKVPTSGSDIILTANVTIPANSKALVNDIAFHNNNRTYIIQVDNSAQFMSSNQVLAHVYQTIKPSSTTKACAWNTLSSPIDKEEFVMVDNLTSSTLLHNIYRYNESVPRWEEYRNDNNLFDKFEDGRGYIYRTEFDGDIKYQGMTKAGDVTVKLTNGKGSGYNLLGNPYTHDIFKGYAFSGANLTNGFCLLTPEGTWSIKSDNDTIPSCTAFMVQTLSDDELVISNTAEGPKSNRSNSDDNIVFTLTNDTYTDVTRIEFKDGEGFNKMQHYNEAAPMLYVNQDGKRFALANVNENTKCISLCLESKGVSGYTISMKANGNFSYLHLIDRLTGNDVDMLIEDKYSFIASEKDNADRFIVKLSYNQESASANDIFAWQNGDDIFVDGDGELQVFDVTGRMVMNMIVNGIETVSLPSQNVYIFRMLGDEIKTQKIVVR